jgi:hypothetical protein
MKKKSLLKEVKQLQKIAGLLKEDDLDTNMNPLIPNYSKGKFKKGDEVAFRFEGEPPMFGYVDQVAKNYDEAVKRGGDLSDWDQLFNNEEAAEDYGYDLFEDWVNDYVSKHKNGIWYGIRNRKGGHEGWFPEEYVESIDGY